MKKILCLILSLLLLLPALPVAAQEDSVCTVLLSGKEARITGSGAALTEEALMITKGGTYVLSGTFSLPIRVETEKKKQTVTLILEDVSVCVQNAPALQIIQAKQVSLILQGSSLLEAESTQQTACYALVTRAETVLSGEGSLHIRSTHGGIQAKDPLTLHSGTLLVESGTHGIRCSEQCTLSGGQLTVKAGSDAIHAENNDPEKAPDVFITGGTVLLESENDGIDARNITVSGGTVTVTAGGGSENAAARQDDMFSMRTYDQSEDSSGKGLKAQEKLVITGGSLSVNAKNDALHSNDTITVEQGMLSVIAGDDGLHANNTLQILSGTLSVQGYEGLEAQQIYIRGGSISVTASDDGLNACGGEDAPGGGMFGPGGFGNGGRGGQWNGRGGNPGDQQGRGGRGMTPPQGNAPGNAPGDNSFQPGEIPSVPDGSITPPDPEQGDTNEAPQPAAGQGTPSAPLLFISGGDLYVNAAGDGLDSNGSIVIEGGNIVVAGPESSFNGALDSGSENGGSLTIAGGTVLAYGNAGMAESFSEASAQCSVTCTLSRNLSRGTRITLQGANGELLLDAVLQKSANSIVFSCPALTMGATCTFTAGTYTQQFTVSSPVTSIGDRSAFQGFGRPW